MNDPKTEALASFAHLQTAIESDREVVGLMWAAIVKDDTSPTKFLLVDGFGGQINLGMAVCHFSTKARVQDLQQIESLHERIAALELVCDEQLEKIRSRDRLRENLESYTSAGLDMPHHLGEPAVPLTSDEVRAGLVASGEVQP